MKYLLSPTIIMITLVFFDQTAAQANVCDTLWWQQLEVEDLYYSNQEIKINDLYEACEDGNIPLMVAYRASVDSEIILYTLRLVGINAIMNLLNARNIYDETFPTIFLERYGAGSRFSFNVDVYLIIDKVEGPIEQAISPPALADICDTLWWQEFELENVFIASKNINTNDLYETCEDGNIPLMVAYRANVSDKTITDILGLTARHDIIELLDARNTNGKSLREMILERYGRDPESQQLFPQIDVHPLTVSNG